MVDESYYVLNWMTPNDAQNERACQSTVFLPIPVHGICNERQMKVELLPELVNETAVKCNDVTSSSGGAPEIHIPLLQKKIHI